MAAAEKMTLVLGALAKPFDEQLSEQGLLFDADTVRHLSLDAEAVSRLKVRGVVGHSIGNRLYDRLAKKVWAEVRRANPAESDANSPSEASAGKDSA